MRTRILLAALTLVLITGCKSKQPARTSLEYKENTAPAPVEGVEFVKVPARAFTFNETQAGRLIDGAGASFQVIQPAFWISKEPVSAATYEAFMGKLPKNGFSYDDANLFLDKFYGKTALPVLLPTEAMFESALLGGEIKADTKLSYLVSDAWLEQPAGEQLCIGWEVPCEGSMVTARSEFEKKAIERFRSRGVSRFFIAMKSADALPEILLERFNTATVEQPAPSDGKKEVVTVGDVHFTMIPVQGGTMVLGATEEQTKYAEDDENPLHEATLQDFKIAETEVTTELWNAVMGYVPVGNHLSNPRRPVANVSWFDAQEFLLRLRELTGKPFRLPTEDEWEYAARGGHRSVGYVFSGSNFSADVAVCTTRNKDGEAVRPQPADVASKLPNELGLYDMSGGVWEWVQGVSEDGSCIQRGGSRLSLNTACRVSNKQRMAPTQKKDTFGLRLAL